MTTQLFSVSSEVFERCPDYIVGCVVARGIDNAQDTDKIEGLLNDAVVRAAASFAETDLKSIPAFAAWRSALSEQGWSASRYPSSVEAITKRVARGNRLTPINPVVDIANAAVLFYSTPIGTHDIDSFGPNQLTVRPSVPGDVFTPIGDGKPEEPAAGEIIYTCGNQVRTRRWVWRQSKIALVGWQTQNVFFPIDGFAEITGSNVEAATEFIAETCRSLLGADIKSGLVSADSPGFSG